MSHFVGLDASKDTTSVCILDQFGNVVREGIVETSPAAIIGFLRGERRRYHRIGLESTNFASWLYEGLARAGLPIICIEARHAHGVLKARINKTDRNDALGIAELMRVGIYKAVHIKTRASREAKLVLTTRSLVMHKQIDLDSMIRAALLSYGLKLEPGSPRTFARRASELARSEPLLQQIVALLLEARTLLAAKVGVLGAQLNQLVDADPVCQRLLSAPGVGPITALTYRSAIDVAERFTRSRNVGVHLGLTPRAHNSGKRSRQGAISKCGDQAARSALVLAARCVLRKSTRPTELKSWGQELRRRKGYGVATVAVARRLAVILHRMWLDDADFKRDIAPD
jgi:transposase